MDIEKDNLIIANEEKKMRISTVLFDLDGTLTDSGPGIMNSVKYALEKVGEPTPDVDELRKFIGPPLKGQFMEHCGIDEEKAAEMVTLYREYFTVTGIFENSVYDGVEEMLKTAEIVEDHSEADEIGLNNTVELYCEDDDEIETYRIVTSVRGSSLNGLVSIESPIGKALLGHKVGERVYIKVNENFGYYAVIRKIENTDDGGDEIRKF